MNEKARNKDFERKLSDIYVAVQDLIQFAKSQSAVNAGVVMEIQRIKETLEGMDIENDSDA